MQGLFTIEAIQTAVIGFLSLGAAIGAAIAAIKGYSARKPQTEPAEPIHLILSKLQLIHEDVSQLETKTDHLAQKIPVLTDRAEQTTDQVRTIASDIKILLDRTQRGE
jgi:hypothetical protein